MFAINCCTLTLNVFDVSRIIDVAIIVARSFLFNPSLRINQSTTNLVTKKDTAVYEPVHLLKVLDRNYHPTF